MNLYSIFLKNINYEKKIITENQNYSYKEILNFIDGKFVKFKKSLVSVTTFKLPVFF